MSTVTWSCPLQRSQSLQASGRRVHRRDCRFGGRVWRRSVRADASCVELLVMILARCDGQLFVSDLIYQTMLVCNAARPIPFKFAFEWFGFADAGEWCSGSF